MVTMWGRVVVLSMEFRTLLFGYGVQEPQASRMGGVPVM